MPTEEISFEQLVRLAMRLWHDELVSAEAAFEMINRGLEITTEGGRELPLPPLKPPVNA